MKNGIMPLKITFDFGCGPDCIYPAALCSDEDVYLVDCGYAGFLPLIEDAMRGAGLEPGALAGVIITHHDHDHMGSLAALRAKYPRVKVYASAVEAEYISGRRKALRLEQAEALQPALPEDARAGGEAFISLLRGVAPAPVDVTLRGGDVLDICGGCEVVDTPGHTPGHISLYLPAHGTVITGDAMVLEQGRPAVANPQFAFDLHAARASLESLLGLDATRYICCHGGELLLDKTGERTCRFSG